MGPKGKLEKNDKPQFINRIGIYENHTAIEALDIAILDGPAGSNEIQCQPRFKTTAVCPVL